MIKRLWITAIFLSTLFIFGLSAEAQKSKKKKRRIKTQSALVAVDGASVYKFPNFDSQIIEYLRQGSKVRASLKPRKGIGGLGIFYKVRTPSKKMGYMIDVDLLTQFKSTAKKKRERDKNPDFEKVKKQTEAAKREPFFFEKYVGGALGMVQFTEDFDGGSLKTDATMFGFKAMGPGVLFDGPPFDVTFLMSFEAPDYYSKFADGSASGFFVLSDIMMPFPFYEGTNSMFSLGMGPMITYTNFQLRIRGQSFDSQEVRIGAAANLALSHRFKKSALRLEGKYYHEKNAYFGVMASFLFFVK